MLRQRRVRAMGGNQRSRIARAGAILSAMPEPRPIYPKHFYAGPPVPRRDVGFILMPFKPEFDLVHEAISAAIENAGLKPQRADADEIFNTRASMEKILWGIAEAQVIVADMSERNVNVFYEAGIAHTVRENVILVTQDRNNFPFDLQHIDHIIYEPDEAGLHKLTERLSRVIRNLSIEPAVGLRSASHTGLFPVEIRREMRKFIQECEDQWKNNVIPEMKRVGGSMPTVHPHFFQHWEPIEEIGFDIIFRDINENYTEMTGALERAYSFPLNIEVNYDHITGYSQVIALHTWILWGAYALDCRNWDAVEKLLHQEINWGYGRMQSFSEFSSFFYPNAASGRIDIAVNPVHNQSIAFADRHFGSQEAMHALIGFWLFATDIASNASNDWLLGQWALSHRTGLERLTILLESDPGYARSFANSVARTDPNSLNKMWHTGLRDQILSRRRLGNFYPFWDPPRIPQGFAE